MFAQPMVTFMSMPVMIGAGVGVRPQLTQKSADEMKTKLMEQKAWATSAMAKEIQVQFICMTLNFGSLLPHTLEVGEGITNSAESCLE